MTYTKSAVICRAALAKSPLMMRITRHGGCTWAFGNRQFSPGVVKWLIKRGEAIRIGNQVRMT